MTYQLWRLQDGEVLIVSARTASGQKQARELEEQGCEFVGTAESKLAPDVLRDGIAKKYIDLGMEAAGWCKRLSAKIEEANALAIQMAKKPEGKTSHDKR